MPSSATLRAQDVRFLYQLVGECRDLGDDPVGWRQHWSAELGRWVAADLIVAGENALRGGAPISLGTAEWGWDNGPSRPVFLEIMTTLTSKLDSDLSTALVVDSYYKQRQTGEDGLCLGRTDLIADSDWYSSRYFDCIHQPIGIDHTLICFRQVPGMSTDFDGLVLSKVKSTKEDFSRRDRKIVEHAYLLLAPHVGGTLARFQDPSPWSLPPRGRQVLGCLLEGDSDKQIAKRLHISPFTVNHYTKMIFRHFHVQSRMELLALWIRRLHKTPFAWLPK